MSTWIVPAVVLVFGYAVGRLRPVKRVRDWSAWEAYKADVKPGWRGEAKALLLMALNPDLVARTLWKRWRR